MPDALHKFSFNALFAETTRFPQYPRVNSGESARPQPQYVPFLAIRAGIIGDKAEFNGPNFDLTKYKYGALRQKQGWLVNSEQNS